MMASERLNRRYQLSFTDALTRAGTPVWSDNGGLVGLILASDQTGTRVIPTSAISSVLSQVLATRPIQRSALGLRVQDVSSLVSEGVRLNWPEQGILVRQVLSTSTAKFLQEGDVIERLDQDSFDGSLDLGERLLDYRPGTSVTIQGIRKGKSFQVDIPLQTTTTGEMLK
jgi:S1-C subfamily serine protease